MEKYFEKTDIVASDNAIAQCCDGIIGILFQNKKLDHSNKETRWNKGGDECRT